MVESQQTANLKALLKQIEEKITALKNTSKSLDDVIVKTKSTFDEMESLHIAGQKYDDEYLQEQARIDQCGEKFTTKRTIIQEIVSEKLASLSMYSVSVSISLAASQAADRATELAAAKKNGA